MAAYRRVDDLRSPVGWLPVHRDQLRAQRSVTSMGKPLPLSFLCDGRWSCCNLLLRGIAYFSVVGSVSHWSLSCLIHAENWWLSETTSSTVHCQQGRGGACQWRGCCLLLSVGKQAASTLGSFLLTNHVVAVDWQWTGPWHNNILI